MQIKKSSLIFYFFVLILTVVIFTVNDITTSIITFILFNILYYIFHGFNVIRPDCWFIPVYSLYSTAFAILSKMGEFSSYVATNKHLLLSWIGLITFCLCVNKKNVVYDKARLGIKIEKSIIITAILLVVGITLLYNYYLLKNPVYNKIDVANSNNIIVLMGNLILPNLSLFFVLMMFFTNLSGRTKKIIFAILIALLLLTFLVNGDRSLVIKNAICGILVYHILIKKITFKKAIIVGFSAMLALSIMSPLKMVLLRQESSYAVAKEDNRNFVVKLLESDFHAAGLNLNTLANGRDQYDLKYGETWLYDIIRPFDMVLPIDISNYSSMKWYQNFFYPGKVTGMGFTLTGEGYINFGVLGVIIEMMAVAALVNYLYKLSSRSGLTISLYICMIPIFMYANRADLANILSPLIKMLIPLGIFYLFMDKREI
ncbi:O-antigen polysaccharide polymerase Wzy [Clostridiaceae bacterium DONG20-135]|uniref:O-antigen polysaccharide polymerase Wzy n=1 Tax=Copranaerobaculum intestinale TaxID=2692629 RepID=A0A6N8UAF4_9FIRM|nr:O-antigen polysaccharide polymerase Wzy [Copranaerobaculum intestinale]MXQ72777.1 O-antigen polysaccharide polymerase Wzy [Copranaerobaculum intestinale]